jgi:hypothetical protein
MVVLVDGWVLVGRWAGEVGGGCRVGRGRLCYLVVTVISGVPVKKVCCTIYSLLETHLC